MEDEEEEKAGAEGDGARSSPPSEAKGLENREMVVVSPYVLPNPGPYPQVLDSCGGTWCLGLHVATFGCQKKKKKMNKSTAFIYLFFSVFFVQKGDIWPLKKS